MNGIIIAIVVVALIGLICGVMLSVASKLMAVPVDERFDEVRNCLPGANCGACGYAGCDAYANALLEDPSIGANKCVPGGASAAQGIAAVLGIDAGEVVPMVAKVACEGTCSNTTDKYVWQGNASCKGVKMMFGGKNTCSFGCLGYGDCVDVCPQNAIDLFDGVSRIDKDMCVGCGLCSKTCPMGIINMIPKTAKVAIDCSNKTKGKSAMTVCKVSCIGCGKCARSCPVGAITMENDLPVIDYSKCVGCKKCANDCPRKCIETIAS